MEKANANDIAGSGLVARPTTSFEVKAPRLFYAFQCVKPNGEIRWSDEFANLVTTAGKTDLVDKYFKGASYSATWFVGLIDASGYTAVAVGDTAASHAGWTETHTTYSQGARPSLSWGTASAGAVNNSASPAAFSMTGTVTVKGAFVISNSTKGGTTGVLYSAGAFAADRAVVSGDTLNVTITQTIS